MEEGAETEAATKAATENFITLLSIFVSLPLAFSLSPSPSLPVSFQFTSVVCCPLYGADCNQAWRLTQIESEAAAVCRLAFNAILGAIFVLTLIERCVCAIYCFLCVCRALFSWHWHY